MTSQIMFTVQEVLPGQAATETRDTAIEASTPAAAAQLVLGRELRAIGGPEAVRAWVWHLKEDFTPVCTPFYEPNRLPQQQGNIPTSGAGDEGAILARMILIGIGVCTINAALVTFLS